MTNLGKCLVLGSLAALAGATAARADATAVGTFIRKGPYEQSAKITALGTPGAFKGSFSVATRGCAGSVDAKGKAESPTRIVFTQRDDAGGMCKITADFAPDFRSVKVSNDGCLYWHGAACDFEGNLKRSGR